MRNSLIAVIAALGCGAAAFGAETYSIDRSHTFPRFEISHFGFSTHHGQFNATSGRIVLDRAARTGSIEIKVDTASISTGDPALERVLRSDKFFNVQKFPAMIFRSNALKFEGDTPAAAAGELTLLDVTRPLTLTISRSKCAEHPITRKDACGAEVTGTLRRSDFGMTAYVPAVGDEVTLHIQVEAINYY